jgi:hypothetical protein
VIHASLSKGAIEVIAMPIFQDKLSLNNSTGEVMRSCFLSFLGFLLVDALCFWLVRLPMGHDIEGQALLVIPIAVHTAWGLVLLAMMKRRGAERATSIGASIAWVLALPLACYSNLLFNLHLTW